MNQLHIVAHAVSNGCPDRKRLHIPLAEEQIAVETIVRMVIQRISIRPANWTSVDIEFLNGPQYPGQDLEIKRAIEHAILLAVS